MPGGILALDPSSRVTGWAYSDPADRMPLWGNFIMRRAGETAKNDAGKIGARFGLFLRARIDALAPRFIVREQPYVGGGKAPINYETLFALLGLAWQIDTLSVELLGEECRQTTTAPAIKFFTGRGKFATRAEKKRATVQTCKLHGWNCTEDEADALAILCYAEAKLFPEMRLEMRRPGGPLFAIAVSKSSVEHPGARLGRIHR